MATDVTIFYSWQNDRCSKRNRYFIRDTLKKIARKLSTDATLEDAPRLDHDTKDISGTPDIPAAILKKIDKAAIFIADVTFVGKTPGRKPKLLPNPNVMLELGYALKVLGQERIVLVMNDAYGMPEKHIFDLRHRRFPTTYTWPESIEKIDKAAREKFENKLNEDIRAAYSAEHSLVENAIESLDESCLYVLRIWGPHRHFSAPPRDAFEQTHPLDRTSFDGAVRVLIGLDLLRCDINPDGTLYAYHWTHLGKLVLKSRGIEFQIPQSDA